MKPFLILILSFSFTITSMAQQDSGFTNKAEAKNLMVNGLKEGKWCEYTSDSNRSTTDSNAPYYDLTVYKADTPLGISRRYYKSGKVQFESLINKGRADGVTKWYYENGTLQTEIPFKDDTINGVWKDYYESGKIKDEYPYSSGRRNGVQKFYWENGNLREETPYIRDTINGVTKEYWQNGKIHLESLYDMGKIELERIYDSTGNEIK